MTALPQYEDGKDQLKSLIDFFNETADSNRNEATTRLHLINGLLLDVLGWPKKECVAEPWQDGKYTDYELGNPRRLVVEAKREGDYFSLPTGFSDRVCRVSTVVEKGTDVKSAVRQAAGYCGERGIPFGAVTNGHQVIAFIGSRQDSIAPLDGYCLAFPSLESMLEDYRTLWECLSRPAVAARNLDRLLRAERLPPPPPKPSRSLLNYPGFKRRNSIQTELNILGGMFIEDIVRRPELQEEFLQECYCPSEALSQYALISKRLIRARYSLVQEKGVQPKQARGKKALARELTRDLRAGNLSQRPVILLGDVGVGKSMFIQHLIHVEARELLERALVLSIDFGEEPALPTDLALYVLQQIHAQLLERYEVDVHADDFVRAAYHGELGRFSRGIYGRLAESDPEEYRRRELEFLEEKLADLQSHLKTCLEHLTATQQRQIVIVLDNVDQRPQSFQDEVFLMAQGFAARWPASVFVALRPDTFYRSTASGSLSGYQTQVFTIAPPRVERAVYKRLRFAKAQLKSKKTLEVLGDGVTFESRTLDLYLDALLQSFAKNQDLVELVDNLSNGNIRRAFDFLKAFIGSGHVDTEKILRAMREDGHYLVAVHEFLRRNLRRQ